MYTNDKFYMGGQEIPAPLQWNIAKENVVTQYSGKPTLDGTLHNSVIRTRETIKVKFGLLDEDTFTYIDTLTSGNLVNVMYHAPNRDKRKQANYICGKKSTATRIIRNGKAYYTDLSFTLTEV